MDKEITITQDGQKEKAKNQSLKATDSVWNYFNEVKESLGLTADTFLSELLRAYKFELGKGQIPERKMEIENFQLKAGELIDAYQHSLQLNQDAEARIYANFEEKLESRNRQIIELQNKIQENQIFIERAESARQYAEESALNASLEATDAKEMAKAQEEIATMLKAKFENTQEELHDYSILQKKHQELEMKHSEQTKELLDVKEEMARSIAALKDSNEKMLVELKHKYENASKDAEIEKFNELKSLENQWTDIVRNVEIKLHNTEKELVQLKSDKEAAINQVKLEAQQEITSLRDEKNNLEKQILQMKVQCTKPQNG